MPAENLVRTLLGSIEYTHPWHGYGQARQLPSALKDIPFLQASHLVLDPLAQVKQSLFWQLGSLLQTLLMKVNPSAQVEQLSGVFAQVAQFELQTMHVPTFVRVNEFLHCVHTGEF